MRYYYNKSILIYLFMIIISVQTNFASDSFNKHRELAKKILANEDFEEIRNKGYEILATGFNAGDVYPQVWIRDLNTFIKYSFKTMREKDIRDALLPFFKFQYFDGQMIDGYEILAPQDTIDDYSRFERHDMPDYAFHKNTVETDQESSLIQAIHKYIQITDDESTLQENINGKTVLERMDPKFSFPNRL